MILTQIKNLIQCESYGIIAGHTYGEGLSSLLDDKALYEVGEDLRFDHGLRNRRSVFVPKPDS